MAEKRDHPKVVQMYQKLGAAYEERMGQPPQDDIAIQQFVQERYHAQNNSLTATAHELGVSIYGVKQFIPSDEIVPHSQAASNAMLRMWRNSETRSMLVSRAHSPEAETLRRKKGYFSADSQEKAREANNARAEDTRYMIRNVWNEGIFSSREIASILGYSEGYVSQVLRELKLPVIAQAKKPRINRRIFGTTPEEQIALLSDERVQRFLANLVTQHPQDAKLEAIISRRMVYPPIAKLTEIAQEFGVSRQAIHDLERRLALKMKAIHNLPHSE